jgi:hypothetical protein
MCSPATWWLLSAEEGKKGEGCDKGGARTVLHMTKDLSKPDETTCIHDEPIMVLHKLLQIRNIWRTLHGLVKSCQGGGALRLDVRLQAVRICSVSVYVPRTSRQSWNKTKTTIK